MWMSWAALTTQKWVWGGANVIEPDCTRALVSLSPGGSDAVVCARIRHADTRIRRRRVRTAGSQVASRLGGPGYRAGRHRLRRRLADRFRLSADRQAVAPRHTPGRRGNDLRGGRAPMSAPELPWIGPRASNVPVVARAVDFWNGEIYELRGVGADSHRCAHRRRRVAASRVAVDRVAHRLDLSAPPPTAPARCWPPTTTSSSPAQRNCRWYLSPTSTPPAPVRVDPGPALDRHAGRRGQPRRDRHTRQLAARTCVGHPGRDQHRHRRRRRHRRRVLPRLQRIRQPVPAAARHR